MKHLHIRIQTVSTYPRRTHSVPVKLPVRDQPAGDAVVQQVQAARARCHHPARILNLALAHADGHGVGAVGNGEAGDVGVCAAGDDESLAGGGR